MNADSRGSLDRPDTPSELAREIRSCTICGTNFSATKENDLCPVCLLREALIGGAESTKSPSEEVPSATAKHPSRRFEHYEVALGEDGRPLELGRGAMGITYKAIDVDLQCPVTLKVIREKYLGDEAARIKIFARGACGGERPSSQRCLRLPPWEEGTRLLLRDGVCRGRNARQSHQALGPRLR